MVELSMKGILWLSIGFGTDMIWDYQEMGTYCEKRETDCTNEFKGDDSGYLIKGNTHTCQHLEENHKRRKPKG